MATVSFTTQLDQRLEARLQKIAARDQQSADFLATQAIEHMVEEREATRDLVKIGLELADQGISISDAAVTAWLNGPEDAPFPEPDTFDK